MCATPLLTHVRNLCYHTRSTPPESSYWCGPPPRTLTLEFDHTDAPDPSHCRSRAARRARPRRRAATARGPRTPRQLCAATVSTVNNCHTVSPYTDSQYGFSCCAACSDQHAGPGPRARAAGAACSCTVHTSQVQLYRLHCWFRLGSVGSGVCPRSPGLVTS